jgi:hypothetical protein
MDLLLRPLALFAIALLAFNDHVLKAWLHNAVTGKLSDVAGCFVLPLFLGAVLELLGLRSARTRLAFGALATALFFTALKLSPTVAALVSHVLDAGWALVGVRTGGILADPTDLLALPAVLAAWAWGVRQSTRFNRGAGVEGAPCAHA